MAVLTLEKCVQIGRAVEAPGMIFIGGLSMIEYNINLEKGKLILFESIKTLQKNEKNADLILQENLKNDKIRDKIRKEKLEKLGLEEEREYLGPYMRGAKHTFVPVEPAICIFTEKILAKI